MSIKKILIHAAILGCMTAAFSSAAAFAETKGALNDNQVNVRAGADKTFDVVDKLSEGDSVNIIGETDDWFRVSYADHEEAYIFKDYINVLEADGVVTGDKIAMREEPNRDADKIERLTMGTEVVVKGKIDDWYLISFGETEGYIESEYIACEYGSSLEDVDFAEEVSEEYGVVTAVTGLNFRYEPSIDSEIIEVLPFMTKADVLEQNDEWIYIKTKDGETGYVNAEFFDVRTGLSEDEQSTLGGQVINYAKQYIGTPYVWGGTNLSTGVDCSGFVYCVYQNFDISLNRSSAAMEAGDGYYVDKSELQPGDLVFFDNDGSGTIDHVGIYMYDGYYIHSSSGKVNGVMISSLSDVYGASAYASAKRVIE